jgi:putative cell wall-binding protein
MRKRQNKRLILLQRQFIEQIMQKFNKNTLKLTENLSTKDIRLEQNSEKALEKDIKAYQREIEFLIYLTTAIRPDLAFSVGNCARYILNPSIEHFRALEKI